MPFEPGDSGSLADLEFPIVEDYLDEIAEDRFGISNFCNIVNSKDLKTIKFVNDLNLPPSIWKDDNTLLVNLYRIHDIAQLLSALVHEFTHVMTLIAGEPMSDREDRQNADPKEYVEFPEEKTAFEEMIKFMRNVLRMSDNEIKDYLVDIVGSENKTEVDYWMDNS